LHSFSFLSFYFSFFDFANFVCGMFSRLPAGPSFFLDKKVAIPKLRDKPNLFGDLTAPKIRHGAKAY
jgi:hypothetical protein